MFALVQVRASEWSCELLVVPRRCPNEPRALRACLPSKHSETSFFGDLLSFFGGNGQLTDFGECKLTQSRQGALASHNQNYFGAAAEHNASSFHAFPVTNRFATDQTYLDAATTV